MKEIYIKNRKDRESRMFFIKKDSLGTPKIQDTRPISITPAILKIIEKVANMRMRKEMKDNRRCNLNRVQRKNGMGCDINILKMA